MGTQSSYQVKYIYQEVRLINPRGLGPHRKHNMKHSKYFHYPEVKNAKLNALGEAVIDFILAIAIGVGMAVLLVAWWST